MKRWRWARTRTRILGYTWLWRHYSNWREVFRRCFVFFCFFTQSLSLCNCSVTLHFMQVWVRAQTWSSRDRERPHCMIHLQHLCMTCWQCCLLFPSVFQHIWRHSCMSITSCMPSVTLKYTMTTFGSMPKGSLVYQLLSPLESSTNKSTYILHLPLISITPSGGKLIVWGYLSFCPPSLLHLCLSLSLVWYLKNKWLKEHWSTKPDTGTDLEHKLLTCSRTTDSYLTSLNHHLTI